MRLLTFRTSDGTRAGLVEGDEVLELDHADVGALLASGEGWADRAAGATGARHGLADLDLAPVVTRPRKIICLGLNYRTHIEEMGRELPRYPTLFAKFASALIGPRDPIVLPPESDQPDWEVELALVIGRPVRRVSDREAEGAIAGFCVFNDITMRDWQARTIQFLQGKTFEQTTPVGPVLVTPDEVGGAADLEVRCEVDGQGMQPARPSDMRFRPAELVSDARTILTLEPGDLIATGTPAGVGAGREPPEFLRSGQVVRTSIEGIGELLNPCVADTSPA